MKHLISDPRVAEAKKLLLEAVKDHQMNLTGLRPPNPELESSYKETIKEYGEQRGGNLWFPFIGSGLGNGPLVELLDGSVKYDFISGIGVHHLGHSHPELISSSIDAAISDTIMQGHLQQNADQVELVELLVKESGLDHCFLSTTGSMANENALKIAFHRNAPANRILAFEGAFCGRTLTMAQITDKALFREGLPVNLGVDYIPFYDAEHPKESTKLAVDTLKKLIARYPKQYAAMIFELIQGEGGFHPGSPDFFRSLMEILKENDIAVIDDEVQTFGRTSRLFAFQHFGLEDLIDIVTIGKLSQVCATIYRTEYKPRPGLLSQTFTSSTQAIHAAKAIINLMNREHFFGADGKNMQVHQQFVTRFETIHSRHPELIRGPYGIGAMVAFSPLDGDPTRVKEFVDNLYHAGVISFICGRPANRTRFLVPVGAVSEKDIDQVCEILEETLLCS